jgi:sugar lactone lactonase YvrE
MNVKSRFASALALLLAAGLALADQSQPEPGALPGKGRLVASGLLGSVGGTIGPDGALYVAEGAVGQVSRVDLASGRTSIAVSGLPAQFPFLGLGGPIDVAFQGTTMYVLVSLVGDPLFGGVEKDGVYKIEDDGGFTVLADLGEFSQANPPTEVFDYLLVNGVQFALEAVADGFLVSDGHLNRVLHVSMTGAVSVVQQFGNVAPSGLVESLGRVFLAEVGPVPHDPATGRIVSFAGAGPSEVVAAGVPMIVDVAFGPKGRLYALSQGDFGGGDPGAPAAPDTGRLLKVNSDGTFTLLAEGIDRPSALGFRGSKAIVITLTGDVWVYQVPPARHGW